MNPLLNAIEQGWKWKLGVPVAIVATNRFGNALVKNTDNHYFRIMPEVWLCEPFAGSATELEEKRKAPDFIRDWEMTVIVSRAEVSQGPLLEGQVYYLVVPAVLGGKYVEDNIKKISLIELPSLFPATWPTKWTDCPRAPKLSS